MQSFSLQRSLARKRGAFERQRSLLTDTYGRVAHMCAISVTHTATRSTADRSLPPPCDIYVAGGAISSSSWRAHPKAVIVAPTMQILKPIIQHGRSAMTRHVR